MKKGFPPAINGVLWKLKTAAFKRLIHLQDRLGLYRYEDWIRNNETRYQEPSRQRERLQKLKNRPLFSLIISLNHNTAQNLQTTIGSLSKQVYTNWEAWLIGLGDENLDVVSRVVRGEKRVHTKILEQPLPARSALLEVLQRIRGQFVMVLASGDALSPDSLFELASYIDQIPDLDILYTDEDQLGRDGKTRSNPFFKPNWSPELMLSTNYLWHALFRSDLLKSAADRERPGEGRDLGDLIFGCAEATDRIHHIPKILYHAVDRANGGLFGDPHSAANHARSVRAHLQRLGVSHAEARLEAGAHIRVTWPVAEKKASLIIPTRDRLAFLKRCVSSVRAQTSYANYEIVLVDSGSERESTYRYYEKLQADPDVRIIEYAGTFNFSAALNLGAENALGEFLVFLNNDTEVIDDDWLEELIRWAERPAIGIVGAKLLYPDRAIQHAGIVIGLEGHASHVFAGSHGNKTTPFGSINWYRNYSAVTGACMAIRREVFDQIGGFDEEYTLAFSDVEICARAIAADYRVMYTPFARLIHHEGRTRHGYIPPDDIDLGYAHMRERVESGDPFFNPNLSHLVPTPTFRRNCEEAPIDRLKKITALMGRSSPDLATGP